jgi:hypothetical protein
MVTLLFRSKLPVPATMWTGFGMMLMADKVHLGE